MWRTSNIFLQTFTNIYFFFLQTLISIFQKKKINIPKNKIKSTPLKYHRRYLIWIYNWFILTYFFSSLILLHQRGIVFPILFISFYYVFNIWLIAYGLCVKGWYYFHCFQFFFYLSSFFPLIILKNYIIPHINFIHNLTKILIHKNNSIFFYFIINISSIIYIPFLLPQYFFI
jgi:hypothetical protein